MTPVEIIINIITLLTFPATINTYDNNSITNTDISSDLEDYWASYMANVCGRTCRNGRLHFINFTCVSPLCFPCICLPSCKLLGTCCPTFDEETGKYSYDVEHSTKKNPMQWFNRIQCFYPPFSTTGYIAIKTCPSDYKNEQIRESCEHAKTDSLDSITPFSDKETGLVFQNAHCAICNGFQLKSREPTTKIQQVDKNVHNVYSTTGSNSSSGSRPTAYQWGIEIECTHYQNLYGIIDKLQFYLEASKLRECNVTFQTPFQKLGNGAPEVCDRDFDPLPADKECTSPNTTINWMCHELPTYFGLRVRGYKNIFCYLCQDRKVMNCSADWTHDMENTSINRMFFDAGWKFPPMLLLFGTSSSLSEGEGHIIEEEDCQSGHWRNNEGDCVPALCSPGKILSNSTCDTAIADIKGLAYNLTLVLVPEDDMDSHMVERVGEILIQTMVILFYEAHISVSVLTAFCPRNENNGLEYVGILEFDISGFVVAPPVIPRDEFEGMINDELFKNQLEMSIERGEDTRNVSLKLACIGNEMCQEYKALREDSHSWEEFYDVFRKTNWNNSLKDCVTNKQMLPMPAAKGIIFKRFKFSDDRDKYIDMDPSLTCPVVVLNMTSEPKLENGDLVFSVMFRDQEINLEINKGLTMKENQLLVCLDEMDDLVKDLNFKTKLGVFSYTERVLLSISYYSEITCLLLSVLCLFLAVVTYIVFPALRAIPGLNNMCLCGSLMVAQISLLITSLGVLQATHCLINAVIIHYSWLASFCWMNTCCIHMYRVFTSTLGPGALTEKKTFRHYCIYSFGIPCLIVSVTIIATSSVTNGESIGYSDEICFIDVSTSFLIQVLSLLVPFGSSVLINFILFCFTVVEIVKVTRHTPSASGSRHGVTAYVKLSTLTGIFIAVAAVGLNSGNVILIFICGPLAALQGIYIFFSFIVNRHVVGLYKELFLGGPPVRKSMSNSSAMKTNNKSSTQFSDV